MSLIFIPSENFKVKDYVNYELSCIWTHLVDIKCVGKGVLLSCSCNSLIALCPFPMTG